MTKTTTIINSISLNNHEINEPEKDFKTFSVHEANLSIVNQITHSLLKYKHLENIINILLQQQLALSDNDNLTDTQKELYKDIFWLLLNPMLMKAVLSNTTGKKYKDSISKINTYFKDNDLFQQAKSLHNQLNAHNSSMIIRRLNKDWKNYFSSLKDFYNGNKLGLTGKPSFPKPKKLSKVFNYSLPLEPSKFSLKKLKQGLLGLNLGKKMFYTYIGKNIDYIQSKTINNVTISYSHGHIYYQFTYLNNDKLNIDNKELILNKKVIKEAGADVGINNLLSLFINDNTTQSLIISGKELISYNVHFNKRLAKTNELISQQVLTYKTVLGKNDKTYEVPESYTELGKRLINRREQLFERRKLYLDDYLNKMSKKVLTYLNLHKVNLLVLSKNLSFTKTTGEIKMIKKVKQKFYQIPFGKLLNLIENKSINYGIEIKWIDEAYTSKTSSISADVSLVQKKGKELREKENKNLPIEENEKVTSNDLKGNRGVKKGLGRGMYKDTMIKKIMNADLNGACNHIKVYLGTRSKDMINKLKQQLNYLWKWCNPVKIKSNHEFDKILKNIKDLSQIVNRQNLLCE
jgi:IS605 OrfB family transposase